MGKDPIHLEHSREDLTGCIRENKIHYVFHLNKNVKKKIEKYTTQLN